MVRTFWRWGPSLHFPVLYIINLPRDLWYSLRSMNIYSLANSLQIRQFQFSCGCGEEMRCVFTVGQRPYCRWPQKSNYYFVDRIECAFPTKHANNNKVKYYILLLTSWYLFSSSAFCILFQAWSFDDQMNPITSLEVPQKWDSSSQALEYEV